LIERWRHTSLSKVRLCTSGCPADPVQLLLLSCLLNPLRSLDRCLTGSLVGWISSSAWVFLVWSRPIPATSRQLRCRNILLLRSQQLPEVAPPSLMVLTFCCATASTVRAATTLALMDACTTCSELPISSEILYRVLLCLHLQSGVGAPPLCLLLGLRIILIIKVFALLDGVPSVVGICIST
jgi:hypothetical protein